MFDETPVKDLVEMYGKSLTFTDIEAVGGYLFKNRAYSIQATAGVDHKVSISPLNAAKILVEESEKNGKLKELFAFTFELDGSPLNSRVVALDGMENLLYRLSRSGQYYDFAKRKLVDIDDHYKLLNWGALRDGREYPFTIASIDICQNSELDHWEGRIWSWAGDGGIYAFRGEEGIAHAVSCGLEILATLPVFNMQPEKAIKDDIHLRIGMDFGQVKFFNDTGRIVSDVINYAAHLEKKGTKPRTISVSDVIHARLSPEMKLVFSEEQKFEGRLAHSTG